MYEGRNTREDIFNINTFRVILCNESSSCHDAGNGSDSRSYRVESVKVDDLIAGLILNLRVKGRDTCLDVVAGADAFLSKYSQILHYLGRKV